MNLELALKHLFPSAESNVDYSLRDDGEGPFIDAWNIQAPIPSNDELTAASVFAEKLQIIAQYTAGVQLHLDTFARTRSYDGILSAATYATSQVPKFKAEGQYAVEARDATWAKCYEILAAVESGSRPMPTLEELIAELPALVWPQ